MTKPSQNVVLQSWPSLWPKSTLWYYLLLDRRQFTTSYLWRSTQYQYHGKLWQRCFEAHPITTSQQWQSPDSCLARGQEYNCTSETWLVFWVYWNTIRPNPTAISGNMTAGKHRSTKKNGLPDFSDNVQPTLTINKSSSRTLDGFICFSPILTTQK